MNPKFSSGYLTPTAKRRKSLPKAKRCRSSENLPKIGEINDEVFRKLMSCPTKRKMIINLISSEKHNIDAYKKKFEQSNSSPLQKVLKKPCESPTAILRRRALEQQKNALCNLSDSGSSDCSRPSSRQSTASTVPTPVSFDKILEGVVAFVEVKSANVDRSAGVKATITSMGATVRDKFTKDVTHVIFKDGSFTTYQKANLINAKLVSVLWLDACKTTGARVAEKDYPAIGTDAYNHNVSALCSQMQREYEEIIREEFNRSLALGTPLPSAKSLINRRRTIMTPNLSGINLLSDSSQDYEVANLMRRTIHENTPIPEIELDDVSDTGAIIDGNFSESANKSKDKSRFSVEDMDLTDLQEKRLLICTKENIRPSASPICDIYNEKTPEITPRDSDSGDNHLDSSIYRRKTQFFGNETPQSESTVLKSKNIKIYSKNTPDIERKERMNTDQIITQKDCLNSETVMSVLQISDKTVEKSSSTNMSSLRITDNSNISQRSSNNNMHFRKSANNSNKGKGSSDKDMSSLKIADESNKNLNASGRGSSRPDSFKSNKNSFSPLQPAVVNNILEVLDKESPLKQRSSGKQKNSTNDSHVQDQMTPINKIKLAENNIIVRRKYSERRNIVNNSTTDSNDGHNGISIPDRNTSAKEEENFDKTNQKWQQTKDLRNKRKTISVISDIELRSAETSPIKKSSVSPTKNSNTSARRINDLDTESPKKKPKYDDKNEGSTTINGSSFNSRSRRTMGAFCRESPGISNKRETRKSMGNIGTNPLRSPDDGITRKLRKLYDPLNPITDPSFVDEEERNDKRRNAKKDNDTGIFIKPTIILSDKTKGKGKSNIEIDEDTSSDESPMKTNNETKKNKKTDKIINSDDDEQVELAREILNKKKNIRDEENTDESPNESLFKAPKGKNNTEDIETPSRKATRKSPRIPKTPNTLKPLPRTPRTTTPKSTTTSVKLTQITPLKNRRSTLEFRSSSQSAKRKLKIDKTKSPSIVCTKMHKSDVQVFNQIVKKLGGFNVEEEVSQKTTHLVAGEPKRTINMLRAITMGCWILKKEWLYKSLESGKWLPEEDFEETDFSPAVQKNRLQRQAFGPSYTMDIFQDCGLIYISRGSTPRCSDLQELVLLCKGKVTKTARSAAVIVGEYMKYAGVTCVTETWILDCISSNKRLPFKKHIISPKRRSVIV